MEPAQASASRAGTAEWAAATAARQLARVTEQAPLAGPLSEGAGTTTSAAGPVGSRGRGGVAVHSLDDRAPEGATEPRGRSKDAYGARKRVAQARSFPAPGNLRQRYARPTDEGAPRSGPIHGAGAPGSP